ncbi:MAG TPA: hypothetical protein VK846_08785, partial [Candidatus Limnocylindria bacterium]|nr:hypothetical protein [Candidatus Limnocylindria bacterium]
MKRILIFLLLSGLAAEAAQTLLRRELFQSNGALTSSSTGAFHAVVGTLFKKAGGPYVAPGTDGFSADLNSQQTYAYGRFELPTIWTNYFIGCWFFHKGTFLASSQKLPLLWFGGFNSVDIRIGVTNGGLVAGLQYGKDVPLSVPLRNQWLWLGIGISNLGGHVTPQWDVRFYVKPIGGVMTNVLTLTNITSFQRQQMTQAGVGTWASPNTYFNGRIGAVSLYSFEDWNDVAYPSELIEPATPRTWYVNPATGSDANSGVSPALAWQTAGKLNEESATCGIFSANSFSQGDTVIIDTSGALLDASHTNLAFTTAGMNVKATNGVFWTAKLDVSLTNDHFVAHSLPNVYQITIPSAEFAFGQSNIVVWEDEKWMNHPPGATFTSVSNALTTNAGCFWTDGSIIYVHPFDDSNPASDGKVYTRSVARSTDGFLAGISLAAANINIRDIRAGKTCMVRATDNLDALASYVVSGEGGFGGTSILAHCELFYGSKHILGLVGDANNSDITIQDVQAEQGSPTASQSPLVSFMSGAAKSNNVHRYVNVRVSKPSGLIGSTNGTTDFVGSTMLMHNSGSGVQFREVVFADCNLAGTVGWGICSNAYVTNCVLGAVQPSAVVSNIIVGTKFKGHGVSLIYNS